MSPYFYFSVALLALLLFFPVSRMIWVLSIRRAERKAGRDLTEQEIQGQRNRARFIAVLLITPFSWFFNLQLLGPLHG